MKIIFLLIAVSLLLAGGFLAAFFWAVRSGQYEDECTPSMRILLDGPPPEKTNREPSTADGISQQNKPATNS